MFEDLKAKIDEMGSPRSIPEGKVETLRSKYPGIPEDYLTFLQEIGMGNLGYFRLFSGPIEADSIYDEENDGLSNIILLGDDRQGYHFGYDMEEDFRLVEIDPRGEVNYEFRPTFTEFVRHRLRNKDNEPSPVDEEDDDDDE